MWEHKYSQAEGFGNSTTFSVPKGALSDNDTVLVFVATDTAHSIDAGAVPTGWVHHGTQTDSSTDSSTSLFSKMVLDASGEPSSWVFTFTGVEQGAWGSLTYGGLGEVSALGGSSGFVSTPGTEIIETTEANSLLVTIAGSDPDSEVTGTAPEGWTERVSLTNGALGFVYAMDSLAVTPGSYSGAFSFSAADRYGTWIVAAPPLSSRTIVDKDAILEWSVQEAAFIPEGGFWGIYARPTRLPVSVGQEVDLLWSLSPLVSTATYHISPSGSDSSGDGSQGNPWRSVFKAYQMASPGDVVQMSAGSYPRHFGDASSSPSGSYIQNNPSKDVGFTLPTSTGQSDDRWVSPPVKFVPAPGASVTTDAMRIDAGGIEFDGTGGDMYIGFIYTKSTSRVVLRNCDFYGTTSANSHAAFGFIDCRVGVSKPGDQDVYQTKADSSTPTIQPRNFYSRRTIWLSAYKPVGSSNHVDTIQIGGMDGLWFEESYVMSNSSPVRVQGFFAKGWTGSTINAKVHNCWLEYTNISEPNTYVEFFNNRAEAPFNIDAGHGTHTGTVMESDGTLLSEYNLGGRPWS